MIYNSSAILRLKELKKLSGENSRRGGYAVLKICSEFMATFEDAFPKKVDFEDPFPDISRMSLEELRGYYTFRTGLRAGGTPAASSGFLRLYAFELINGFTCSPGKSFDSLLKLASCYMDSSAGPQIAVWAKDYYVAHSTDIGGEFSGFAERAGLDAFYGVGDDLGAGIASALKKSRPRLSPQETARSVALVAQMRGLLAEHGICAWDLVRSGSACEWSEYEPFDGAITGEAEPEWRHVRLGPRECFQLLGSKWMRGVSLGAAQGAEDFIAAVSDLALGSGDAPDAVLEGTRFLPVCRDPMFMQIISGDAPGVSGPALEHYERARSVWADSSNPRSSAVQLRFQSEAVTFSPAGKVPWADCDGLTIESMTLSQFRNYASYRSLPGEGRYSSSGYPAVLANEYIAAGHDAASTLDRLKSLLEGQRLPGSATRTVARWLKDYAIFWAGVDDFPAYAVSSGLAHLYPEMFFLCGKDCPADFMYALSDYQLNPNLTGPALGYKTAEAVRIAFTSLADAFGNAQSLKTRLFGPKTTSPYVPLEGACCLDAPLSPPRIAETITCADESFTRMGDGWLRSGFCSDVARTDAIGFFLRIVDSFLCRCAGIREAGDNVGKILSFSYSDVFPDGPERDVAVDLICTELQKFVLTGAFKPAFGS